MLDHNFTPRTTATQTQTFTSQGSTGTVVWQSWVKPRNIGMVFIRAIGAGGGGGGGMTGASGTARGGGGGGGSAAITDLLVPAQFLPDVMYIMVARGANGGTATNIGVAGERSSVSFIANNVTAAALIVTSGASVGGGGGAAGTVSVGGAGGTAGSVAITTSANGHGYGLFFTHVGQVGGQGGAVTGAVGTSVTFGSIGSPLMGGAGGGATPTADTNFAGGGVSGAGLMPTILGGAAAAGQGLDGVFMNYNPMWAASGGFGGGTAGAAGTAGAGGNGAIGSGGGGGGGGVTGGAGGRGGDGLVLISCW